MSDLADPKGPWAAAIGRAFVAFGNIEFITLHCLEFIPKDRIQRSASALGLVQRVELLQELLEANKAESASELSRQLGRAKALAPTRNLLAHNPIFVDFYQHKDGSYVQVQRIRSVAKPKRTLTLTQVETFADEAENLANDLYHASSAVIDSLQGGAVA